ncbi:hypothetical protein GOBAR_DD05239 [Gossypium barbadense]|nr:hypothetical protein GOBAR_DD05239 [Gossypium barbadense]
MVYFRGEARAASISISIGNLAYKKGHISRKTQPSPTANRETPEESATMEPPQPVQPPAAPTSKSATIQ